MIQKVWLHLSMFQRLLLDEHTPETEEFCIGILNMSSSSTQPACHYSSSSGISNGDGKENGFIRTIAKLPSTKEVMSSRFFQRSYIDSVLLLTLDITLLILPYVRGCWFYGEINSILSRNSWAYLGCYDPTCYKKAIGDNGEYFCTKYDVDFLEGVWKHNLRLRVKHKRNYADIMLWDGDTQRLIGKAAGEFTNHLDPIKKLQRAALMRSSS